MVPVVGIEPTLPKGNGILNPARLPIPPHRHVKVVKRRRAYSSVRHRQRSIHTFAAIASKGKVWHLLSGVAAIDNRRKESVMKSRLLALSKGKYAYPSLAFVAFIESSVFPIPPDVMVIPMVLADRTKAWRIATVCTIASVAGGLLGYVIGAFAWDTIGQPLLELYGKQDSFEAFRAWFERYGFLAVFGAGLTPFPYKVITIASGFSHINLAVFMTASVIARGGRFFLEAALLRLLGNRAQDLIERHFTGLVVGIFALVIASFMALKLIH
jgi:membrane protein YqaA with SNARE-associated domain